MSRAHSPSARARKLGRSILRDELVELARMIELGELDPAEARAVLLTMRAKLRRLGNKLERMLESVAEDPTLARIRAALGRTGQPMICAFMAEQPPGVAEQIARLVFERSPDLLVASWSVDAFVAAAIELVEAQRAITGGKKGHELTKGGADLGHHWVGWVEIDDVGHVTADALIAAGRSLHAELQDSDAARSLRARVP